MELLKTVSQQKNSLYNWATASVYIVAKANHTGKTLILLPVKTRPIQKDCKRNSSCSIMRLVLERNFIQKVQTAGKASITLKTTRNLVYLFEDK